MAFGAAAKVTQAEKQSVATVKSCEMTEEQSQPLAHAALYLLSQLGLLYQY